MTKLYLVRHAQPDFSVTHSEQRPLTPEGAADSLLVTSVLEKTPLDKAVSSPYPRSVATIAGCAAAHGLTVHTDLRLRERESGPGGNTPEQMHHRWEDFSWHEPGGEPLASVQRRNVEAVRELLTAHEGGSVLVGTHGTAMSTILNFYDPMWLFPDFWRIINFMPYILCLDFMGQRYLGREELLIVHKEYKPKD